MSVLPYYLFRESFQDLFVGDVSDKMVPGLPVNDTDLCTGTPELVGDTTADALRSAGNNGYLVVKFHE